MKEQSAIGKLFAGLSCSCEGPEFEQRCSKVLNSTDRIFLRVRESQGAPILLTGSSFVMLTYRYDHKPNCDARLVFGAIRLCVLVSLWKTALGAICGYSWGYSAVSYLPACMVGGYWSN